MLRKLLPSTLINEPQSKKIYLKTRAPYKDRSACLTAQSGQSLRWLVLWIENCLMPPHADSGDYDWTVSTLGVETASHSLRCPHDIRYNIGRCGSNNSVFNRTINFKSMPAHTYVRLCDFVDYFTWYLKFNNEIWRIIALHRRNVQFRRRRLAANFTPSKLFYHPSEKGSFLKWKNLLPVGANSFLLE